MCFNYYKNRWWIEGMYTNHMEKRLSKIELKWMNNECSKLAIQEKFIKIIYFLFLGAKKTLDNLGLSFGMALHHLNQFLFSKCWKTWEWFLNHTQFNFYFISYYFYHPHFFIIHKIPSKLHQTPKLIMRLLWLTFNHHKLPIP